MNSWLKKEPSPTRLILIWIFFSARTDRSRYSAFLVYSLLTTVPSVTKIRFTISMSSVYANSSAKQLRGQWNSEPPAPETALNDSINLKMSVCSSCVERSEQIRLDLVELSNCTTKTSQYQPCLIYESMKVLRFLRRDYILASFMEHVLSPNKAVSVCLRKSLPAFTISSRLDRTLNLK